MIQNNRLSVSRRRPQHFETFRRIPPSPCVLVRGRKQALGAPEPPKHSQPSAGIRCGGPNATPLLSGTQPKSPCPRRGPRPKTTVFLPDAGGNPESLPASSSRDQRLRRERRPPASKHDGGSGPGYGHSISLTDCGLWCSGSRCEQTKCELPCWYHQSLDCWRGVAMIASAPNSGRADGGTRHPPNNAVPLSIRFLGRH